MAGSGDDILFVGLLAVDSKGNHGKIVGLDGQVVQFRLQGDGTVVAVNQRELTPNFKTKTRLQQGLKCTLLRNAYMYGYHNTHARRHMLDDSG